MRTIKFCLLSSILVIIFFAGCGTKPSNLANYSNFTSLYELYQTANKIDSNTEKYIKNKYLIDLIVNASKNEQLGLYHQAIVDLLDALRFDSSKVILFALARNFYFIEKYTLAFDYGFRSYLIDTNFAPTVELLAWTLLARNQYNEANYFSNRLLQIKGKDITQNDIKLHLNVLEKIDTTYEKTIEFLNAINIPNLEDFVNSQLLYYYILRNDTSNQNRIVERLLSKTDKISDSNFLFLNLLFSNLIQNGDYEKAFNKFKEISDKTSPDIALKICDLFIQRIRSIDSLHPDFSGKFSIFIGQRYKNNYLFDYKLLQMYFILGDTAQVYSISKNLLANEEIDLEILTNVSYILFYNLNRKEETIQKFVSFKFKFLNEPLFYNILGEFYVNNKQYDLAKNAFQKSYQLDSTNYQIFSNLAWLYAELEDWEKSDSLYLKSLELFPNNPITLNNFAYSLIQRDTNLSYAGKLIEKAIKLRPNDPNLLDTYGWYLYKIKDYYKAKEHIEKSIELDSSRPEPFLHLSIILRALGKEEEANKYFEKAVSIDPNNKEVLQEIEKQKK